MATLCPYTVDQMVDLQKELSLEEYLEVVHLCVFYILVYP